MEGYMLPGWMRGHRIIQLGSGDLALRDDAPGELWLGKLLGFSLSFTREAEGIVSAVPFLLKNKSNKVSEMLGREEKNAYLYIIN